MGKEPSPYKIPASYLIHGFLNNRSTVINLFQNAKTKICMCIDSVTPIVIEDLDWLKDAHNAAKKRGISMHCVTDITKENLSACRNLMSAVTELRHIGGLAGNFGVSDSECISIPTTTGEIKRLEFVHSDSENVVRQQQMVFDTLWTCATPAYARIDELEHEIKRKLDRVIDRIYICKKCEKSFVFVSEIEDHMSETGHGDFTEFPLRG